MKTKNKKIAKTIMLKAPLVCFILVSALALDYSLVKVVMFVQNPVPLYTIAEVNAQSVKTYKYNDQVPVEVVKQEIRTQARAFGVDEEFMLGLANCESTYNNLADNNTSTAKGIFQFVALTWEATESNRNKISEFDYKANIREAMIKIANGEYSHWRDCIN